MMIGLILNYQSKSLSRRELAAKAFEHAED